MRARLAPGEELSELLPPITSAIRTGRASGGLLRSDGRTCGIVTWLPAGPLGIAVRLLHLDAPSADVETYRAAIDVAERTAGPIAFLPGQLAGLSEPEESSLLLDRGFAAYGRSEMSLAPAAPVPSCPAPPGVEVRPVRPSDEPALARLHERAYEGHLDRYLALEALDPRRDADRQHVLQNLDKMVVKSANESGGYGIVIGSSATRDELDERIKVAFAQYYAVSRESAINADIARLAGLISQGAVASVIEGKG